MQARTTEGHDSLATLQQIKPHKKVGLLVLDSVGLPFRQDACFQTESPLHTARVVGLVGRTLCQLAQDRRLAVRYMWFRDGCSNDVKEGREGGGKRDGRRPLFLVS